MKKIVVAGVVSAVLALVVGPELDGVSGIIMPEKENRRPLHGRKQWKPWMKAKACL